VAIADELTTYLERGEADTPERRAARSGALCEAMSRLLQALMERDAGWDSDEVWLDGIAPLHINQTSPDSIDFLGAAYVVSGSRCSLRPVHAELLRPPAKSTLHFASPDTDVAYTPGREDRLVIPPDPAGWPYVFEFELPT
jgi:hypothetical protein